MKHFYNYPDYMIPAKQDITPIQNHMMPNQENNQNIVSNMNPNINDKEKGLFTPYEGFIRGNMFKALYDSYKINTPYEVKPMNEQAEMLTTIDSLCFAIIDLNLYLDNHPDDKNLITLYNEYRRRNNEIKAQYERKFGPLVTSSEALNTYPWAWNNKPWPWENM